MKKRLLSALLALALVFVLLPTTALAGETTYSDSEITISGKYWNFGKKGTSGEYAPVYFRSNGTAFEESKPTGSNYLEIKKTGEKEITITVYGTVNLTENESSTNSCISVNSNGVNERNLIITGAAKGSTLNLTCKNNSHPLYSYEGSITINGGVTVNATSQCSNNNNYVSVYGIQVYKGGHNLTISGANTKVNVANKTYDSTVKVDGNITVSDGAQLKAENKSGKVTGNTSKKAYAIECGGQFSISGDKTQVTADTSNGKKAISGTVNNGDKLTFKAANSKGSQIFLQRPMDEALGYAYVEITQAPTDPYVLINGQYAIIGQETPIPGGTGTYLYKKTPHDGSFLTLKGVDITGTKDGPARFIQFGKNGGYYTIQLEGENKISGFSSGIVAPEDPGVNDVTVVLSGSGSLDITANQYAIDMQVGKLKFENTGTIKLTTGYNYYVNPLNALRVKTGNISIDNTKYDIVGARQEKNYPTETISDSSAFTPDLLNGYTVGEETTLFKTITITPAAAKDSTIRYNGTTLKQGEIIKGEISGTATVDREKNTITLDNFKGNYPLEFNAEFTPNFITLIGDSTLSAVETKYQNLTISGSGSLTVGSIKVHNQKTSSDDKPNLTINGATVTVGTAELTTRAIDIDGNLTVTNGSLTATSTSNNVPTVQVGGDATFTGSTVTITNNSTALHKDAAGSTKGDSVSSALYVKGNINTDNANVTAKVENGGGNAIGALGNITVNGSTVTAVNKGQKFTTIIAKNVYVSGDSKITANNLNGNPVHDGSYLTFPAIEGNIVNQNTDYSLKFKGQHNGTSEPKTTLAPGEQTTLYYYNVTITRGDEVARTESPVVIAGTTLRNDTYYTITNGSTVAEGTENNYNAFYDSTTKTLKLNNAKISTTTKNAAIKISEDSTITTITVTGTNELKGNHNHCIESYDNFTINGTGTLNMTNTNSSSSATSVIHCGPGKSLTIAAEVIIKNEAQPGNLISTVEGAYSFAKGYNVYASTDVSGSPLETYDAAKSSTYKYLCVTKENLAPTTPTTYTVTITPGVNMERERESGALTQEVTKGAAITEVKFMAASGHYFPADYVSKMNLPAGLTAEIRENSWYLIISGTPTSDVTINLPAASVRPTITVSMPTPVAGNTPATANDITLTYSDINKSVSKKLSISNVVWWSYVSNGNESITPGNTLSSGDKFVEGTEYYVTIDFEGVSENYAIVPAADTTAWRNAEWGSRTMTLYFNVTGAPCNHEYTNDWLANGNTHWHECKLCRAHAGEVAHTFGDWITDTPATDTTDGSKHRTCSVCQYKENATIPKTGTGEIEPPTPDNPGTIVIIRPAEEEKPAQQPNPSTGANDLVGLAVAAAVAAALGSAALLRKHD